MPFDGQEENIGETALLNDRGGAIAFFGTTRTVYQSYNRLMNLAFTRHLLSSRQKRTAIGEAVRLAKNQLIQTGSDQTANKLQYTLLGDPALTLAIPTRSAVIETINDQSLSTLTEPLQLGAGSTIKVTGHVNQEDGQLDETFNGELTATVRDAAEEITCRHNDKSEAETVFTYTGRDKTLFQGSDSIHGDALTSPLPSPRISAMPTAMDRSPSMLSTTRKTWKRTALQTWWSSVAQVVARTIRKVLTCSAI